MLVKIKFTPVAKFQDVRFLFEYNFVSVCVFFCLSHNKSTFVSAPIKLKLGGDIEYTHSSILPEIYNDSLHDENAARKKPNHAFYPRDAICVFCSNSELYIKESNCSISELLGKFSIPQR